MKNKTPPVKRLRTEIQLPVSDLRIGMFVSRLDCGWHNTPFMLEGILLREAREIATLANFARQVMVDPRRSELKSFSTKYLKKIYEEVPVASTAPAENSPVGTSGKPTAGLSFWKRRQLEKSLPRSKPVAKAGSELPGTKAGMFDSGISRIIAAEPDIQFKQYIFANYNSATVVEESIGFFKIFAGLASNLTRLLDVGNKRTRVAHPVPAAAKPSYIPADIQLVIYPEPEPTYVSLPKARAACDHVEESLRRIVDDISIRGISDVETLREAADTVVDNVIARPDTMMWISKMRAYSDARYQQALNVAIYLTALGRQIGFQRAQLADLATVGLLLDMGKVTIDAALLNKPGRLNQFEIEIVRTHVQQGLKMFGESGNLPEIMTRAIAEHHERVDGTGYPNHLIGKDISIYGKMAAIVDSFVAMVNPRPYAPTYSAYDAIRQLFRESDSRWFRPMVEQFVQSIGIFPVGSLVEISTGEVAIIVQHNRLRRMEPKILVVTNREKAVIDRPWDLDVLRHNQNANNAEIRILKGVADGAYGIDFRKYYLNKK